MPRNVLNNMNVELLPYLHVGIQVCSCMHRTYDRVFGIYKLQRVPLIAGLADEGNTLLRYFYNLKSGTNAKQEYTTSAAKTTLSAMIYILPYWSKSILLFSCYLHES